MVRIAFIGAGSVEFSRKLLRDIVSFEDLADTTFAFHDIDPDRLATAVAAGRQLCGALGVRSARVEGYADRREALDGSSYVINMVQVGGHEATLRDFDIPERFGIRQTIADTLGVGGVFRALRTIPVLFDTTTEMAELCPDAWLLNYTNPMAMLCQAAYTAMPDLKIVGLCHSVQGTVNRIAGIVGVPTEEVRYLSAGVNHQAFMLRIEHDGRDLYPLLDEAIARDPDGLGRQLRIEIYRRLGYYQTESSEHAGEYLPWFLGHDSQVERFRLPIREYVHRSEQNLQAYLDVREAVRNGGALPAADPSVEYASRIIHAIEADDPCVVYGNMRNGESIANLQPDACIEVPCLVDANGVRPTRVGALPPQLAAANRGYLNVVELVVHAMTEHDPLAIRHAVMYDPNIAGRLTLDEVWELCDQLTDAHGDLMPAWARTTRTAAPA